MKSSEFSFQYQELMRMLELLRFECKDDQVEEKIKEIENTVTEFYLFALRQPKQKRDKWFHAGIILFHVAFEFIRFLKGD